MITIDIDKCVWVPSSKTLIAPKQDIMIGPSYPLIIIVEGFKVIVQFFWDTERRVYKFDRILRLKYPNVFFDETELKQILIVVV